MITYLGYFSKSFIMAIMLWPVISLILTLPILALLYHRQHRLRFLSAAASYLAVLYFVGIMAFTLYPMPDDPKAFCAAHVGHYAPQLNLFKFIGDIQHGGTNGILQLAFNVVFFVPLGFILLRWARWPWWVVILAGFCTSLFIESSQLTGFWGLYPCAYRQFDVDDLLTNTLGAVVGLLIALLYGLLVPERALPVKSDINTKPSIVHRSVTFILDMLFVAIVYFPLTMALVAGFYKFSVPQPNGEFLLFNSITCDASVLNRIAPTVALIAFAIFEVIIPFVHRGQTLGGMFTHMTFETDERHGIRRIGFYLLRTLILALLVWMSVVGLQGDFILGAFAIAGFITLAVVYFMMHQKMPWDCVPANSRAVETDESAVSLESAKAEELENTAENKPSAAQITDDTVESESVQIEGADEAPTRALKPSENAVVEEAQEGDETAVLSNSHDSDETLRTVMNQPESGDETVPLIQHVTSEANAVAMGNEKE